MAYQGFSPKLELAKAFERAKVSSAPVSEVEKTRRKQMAKVRADKLLQENLAQRALIEGRRR